MTRHAAAAHGPRRAHRSVAAQASEQGSFVDVVVSSGTMSPLMLARFLSETFGMPMMDLLALDDALTKLTQTDAQLSRVVELRAFGGLTTREIAQVLDVSERTVERAWATARAWLRVELGTQILP